MPTLVILVMQKLLVFSLFCGSLAAPVSPKLHLRQFPETGPAGPPGSRQPPFGDPEGNRQWGVLYPRPPRHSPQEGAGQDAPAAEPPNDGIGPTTSVATPADPVPPAIQTSLTIAASTAESTILLSSTNSASPTLPTSGTDSTPGTLQPGPATSITTLAVTVSTTLTESALTSDIGSPPTLATSPNLPVGSVDPAPTGPPNSSQSLPATGQQSTTLSDTSSLVGTTTQGQPTIPANITSALPSGVAPPSGSAPLSGSAPIGTLTSIITPPAQSTSSAAPPASPSTGGPAGPLRLSLVNNLASNHANAYVSGVESSSGKVVMLTAAGTFYYLPETGSGVPQPIAGDVAIPLPPQGQSLQISIPGFVDGARVWFADGTLDFSVVSSVNGPALVEPTVVRTDDASAQVNWGFVELAYVANYGLFANLSFVDFVGMPLGLQLQTASSRTQTVPGMPRNGVQQMCNRLRQYRGKGAKYWASLCGSNSSANPIRVISPAVLLSQQPSAFPTYFQRYVDNVWNHYTNESLTIDTQTPTGKVSCRVVGNEMQCDGDNRGYAKPNAGDIFGCDTGSFAIQTSDNAIHRAVVPRLCAAFNRGTLLLPGGDVQPALPASSYYTARPYNVYSAIAHQVEVQGDGYAFSYDDVAASPAQNVAGTVAAGDPSLLTVFVGGM